MDKIIIKKYRIIRYINERLCFQMKYFNFHPWELEGLFNVLFNILLGEENNDIEVDAIWESKKQWIFDINNGQFQLLFCPTTKTKEIIEWVCEVLPKIKNVEIVGGYN